MKEDAKAYYTSLLLWALGAAGAVCLLVIIGMSLNLLDNRFIPLVEGQMPMQLLFELTLSVAAFAIVSYLMGKSGFALPVFWQGTLFWAFLALYLKYRIYPPIPFSVRAMYLGVAAVAVFMWMSSNEEDWQKFKQPIFNVMDGITPMHKGLRVFYLVAIPVLVGMYGFTSFYPSTAEPIELRTVHPAPPATTKVHGRTFVLQIARNPYRVGLEGKYNEHYPNEHIVDQGMGRLMKTMGPEDNPWHDDATGYIRFVREGGEIFFQNCHFCHGDNLNGRGLHAFAFNPIPANFTDAGTIAQLQETFLFWRVSKGGIGLPREAFPWASTMPPWEQHLTTDEIWKVIMFEYWHTGYFPRTWD